MTLVKPNTLLMYSKQYHLTCVYKCYNIYTHYILYMQTLRDLDVSVLITSTPVKSKVTDINAMIDTD